MRRRATYLLFAAFALEFYELVRDRLTADGMFAQWVASQRTLNSVTEVFPHVVTFAVPSHQGSQLLVASNQPIDADLPTMLERLAAIDLDQSFRPDQARSLAELVATASPVVQASGPGGEVPRDALNHDLAPRDEYFLNNSLVDVGGSRPVADGWALSQIELFPSATSCRPAAARGSSVRRT